MQNYPIGKELKGSVEPRHVAHTMVTNKGQLSVRVRAVMVSTDTCTFNSNVYMYICPDKNGSS